MRIAATVMLKNETTLLQMWSNYHGRLFGYENLFIFDNGSTNSETRQILEVMRRRGSHIINANSPTDFERKGQIVSDLMESQKDNYDWFVPLDADEMLVLIKNDCEISCSKEEIVSELSNANTSGKPVLRIDRVFSNIPSTLRGYKDHAKKTIVRSGHGIRLDMGFHLYSWDTNSPTIGAENFYNTNLGHVHFHNRQYADLITMAREKLKLRVPDFSAETLRNYKGAGRHLTKYFFMTEEEYYSGMRSSEVDLSPLEIATGLPLPFSESFGYLDEDDREILFDPFNPYLEPIASSGALSPDMVQKLRKSESYVQFGCNETVFEAVKLGAGRAVVVLDSVVDYEHIKTHSKKLPHAIEEKLHIIKDDQSVCGTRTYRDLCFSLRFIDNADVVFFSGPKVKLIASYVYSNGRSKGLFVIDIDSFADNRLYLDNLFYYVIEGKYVSLRRKPGMLSASLSLFAKEIDIEMIKNHDP